MRVLYSYPDTVGKPGIGWVAYHHVQNLITQGVDVDLYCTFVDPACGVQGARTLVTTLSAAGRRIPHRALGVRRSYRYHDWRVARALARSHPRVDLVHCWPRATLETAAVARAKGIPVVREAPNTHTAHAFEVVRREHDALGLPLAKGQTHAFNRAVLELEEAEYAAADLLLVPSPLAEKTFVAHGVRPERIALHEYGYEPERFRPRPARTGDRRPLTVLFAARCEPRKGLHLALRAWHDSGLPARGARLIVCGEFVPGYREIVEPLFNHASVEQRGFVDDLEAVMRDADVFLLPSIEEGSALVTYAAQGCGCVPVVSDAAGARCEHMRDGLVHEAGDVAELARHLRAVDQDRALLERLSRRTLARARELTWAASARRLRATYERVLERRTEASSSDAPKTSR
jgi:glycosyltransferase involved in cell wall biosynthesis